MPLIRSSALFLVLSVLSISLLFQIGCSSDSEVEIVEVIKEVPVEKEVIKEVEVPGETITVTKEVIKEVEVPGETVVVEKEVIKEVEVVKEVLVQPDVAPDTSAGMSKLHPDVQSIVDDLGISDRLGVPGPSDNEPSFGGNVFTRGLEPKSFDQHQYSSYRLRMTNSYSQQRLLRYEAGAGKSPTTFNVVPSLAESYSVSDDGLKYSFVLRDNVHFHDVAPVNGRALTAGDFVWTIDRIKAKPDTAVQQNGWLSKATSWEAPADNLLTIELSEPVAAFLQFMGRTLMEPLANEMEAKCQDFAQPECSHVGTGPWQFHEYKPGTSTEHRRNSNYWERPYPYIESVTQIFFGDERSEDAAFRTGKLDLLGIETCGISGERFRALSESNPDSLYPSFIDTFNRRSVWMKSDRPPFDDVNVRRAVSMSVDREGWVKSVLGDYGIPFGSYLYYGNDYWLPDSEFGDAQKYITYDPEGAKELLAQAGYKPGDLTVDFISTTGYGERIAAEAELMAGFLKAIGIETEFSMVDYDSFIPVWRDGNYENLAYTFLGFGSIPEDWFWRPWHPEQLGVSGYGVDDPNLTKLIDEMTAATDKETRIRTTQEMAKIIAEQAYSVPAPSWIYFYAQSPRLTNYTYHDSFDNGYALSMGWIED